MFGLEEEAVIDENGNAIIGDDGLVRKTIYNKGTETFIRFLTGGFDKPIEDCGDLHLAMLECHDVSFGLEDSKVYRKDHTGKDIYQNTDDLKPMLTKPAYQVMSEGSLLDNFIHEFIINDIAKYTNLSLADWMTIPQYTQKLILKNVETKKQMENKANDEAASQLTQSMNNLKK